MRTFPLLVAALLVTGCKNKDDDTNNDDGLSGSFTGEDPLDPSHPMLPFPSDYHTRADDSTTTALRVNFVQEKAPINRDGVQLTVDFFNEKDGWSTGSQLMTWFEDMSDEGLISWTDLSAYTDADVNTVIIDTETGERIPHFGELDKTVKDLSQSVLILRPTRVLEHNRRYVVGIRGLTKTDGSPVDVSKGFAALRDGESGGSFDVDGRADHFDDEIFPHLADQGFERDELQLAWDFTTVSQDNSIGRMLWMRDDMYDRLGKGGPDYDILSVEDHDCSVDGTTIARTIEGELYAPMYTEEDFPGTILTRDADGQPSYNGESTASFLIRIPCSIAADPKPYPILQYGHGLLGDRGEARTGWLSQFAEDNQYVIFAMDWKGMSAEDVPGIILSSAADPSELTFLPERSMQGFVEKLAGMRMMMTDMVSDDAVAFDGTSVVDPDRRYYYGNSQGGILGGALVALSPDIEQGVLGVGALNYSMFLTRSVDFDPYFLIFKEKYLDGRDISVFVTGLLQLLWEPGESLGYAHGMNRDPFPNTPAHDILLQVGVGDVQVHTLGAHLQARAYGADQLEEPYREVFELGTKKSGSKGSAYVEFFYTDAAEEILPNVPPTGRDPHECPRRSPEGQAQIVEFFASGKVEQFCNGGEGPCEYTEPEDQDCLSEPKE